MTMPKQTILVVEDDAAIRRGLVDAMRLEGFEALQAADAKSGLDAAVGSGCDLVLLDLRLPKGDGFSVLKGVRSVRPTLPVIILTARGDEEDRVRGLREGADDYVVKPFSVLELAARVRAVLRRSPGRPLDVAWVQFGTDGPRADLLRRELIRSDGRREELSEREAELLRYLAANGGRAVSRDELLSNVWRVDPVGLATRTIDMQVVRLREKLGDDGEHPRWLLTVRGKGYMLADEIACRAEGGQP